MAVSRYLLKTMDGIDRPAIAAFMPNMKDQFTCVLDLGANVDCSAEHLLQFAVMGSALVTATEGRAEPVVGLLNIGEEVIKGSEVIKRAGELLRAVAAHGHLNYFGNVEGNDIFKGTADVVVCDGFVGNIALKSSEGLAKMMKDMIRQEFERSLFTKLAALVAHARAAPLPGPRRSAPLQRRRAAGPEGPRLQEPRRRRRLLVRPGADPRARRRAQPASRRRARRHRRYHAGPAAHGRRIGSRKPHDRPSVRRKAVLAARTGEYSQINAALHSRVAGTGSDLPPLRLTNNDLVEMLAKRGVETSDDWIVERTGIRARHFVADDVHASDLATAAALRALEAAGCTAADIDLIIVATSTPDMIFPSTASIVQRKLGVHGCAAFDVQAVCSGFIYALSVADAMIKAGSASRALVIGAEVFSRLLDFDDRTTCVLFGDGAGAVVLEASDTPGVVATKLHADGRHLEILCTPGTVNGGKIFGDPLLKMDGPAVFKLAVGVLGDVANEVLELAGRTTSDVDWLVPHQANIRIMLSTARKLKLPAERVVVTVAEHGNTSAASIPLALDVAIRSGQIQRGQRLLLEGVGGGFTWGAALVDY